MTPPELADLRGDLRAIHARLDALAVELARASALADRVAILEDRLVRAEARLWTIALAGAGIGATAGGVLGGVL